jgi:hypothetical protein
MSRAIAILWLGAGSSLVSASSPQVELALFRTCGRLSLRRTKRRSSLPPLWFHCFCRDGSPSVRETGKRDGCRVANHGPIGDSWPIAFFGHPRGHRVFIETRCPKAHTAYYGVRYSPSKPSVSAIRRITAKNDPQDGNDSLSETLKRLAASDVGHRNALLSSNPLK